jgi:hypothetical protein
MAMDLFLGRYRAGCASIGWAVTHFVSRSLSGLGTGRPSFVSSASAAGPDVLRRLEQRCSGRRRFVKQWPSTAGI